MTNSRTPEVRTALIIVTILWLAYAMLTVFAPVGPGLARYGISVAQGSIIRATVLLPQLFIWLMAIFAVTRFKRYTALINGGDEERGFKKMTIVLLMLFLVVVVPPFINLLAAYYPDSFIIGKWVVISRGYITIALYLAAFWNIARASQILNESIGVSTRLSKFTWYVIGVLMAVLTTAYVWTVFHNAIRTVSSDSLIKPTYYLTDWLIVLTILIPYLLVWLCGSVAIAQVLIFAKNVQGVVYKKAFNYVARGLTVTITLLISLQLLSQAGGTLGRTQLKTLLLIVYVLLIVIALGYLYLARGARQLSAIEEV